MSYTTPEEKIGYLELYQLQLATIKRCYTLSGFNADKKERYKQKISEAVLLRDIIEEDIEKVEDKFESEVLAQKYLCGKSLGETADLLNYSKRQIERIHQNAIEHLRPSYKN